MGIFGKSYSEDWHRQLDVIVAGGKLHPIGSDYDLNPDFPWLQTRQVTDYYLSNKKWKAKPEQCDAHLVALIQKYAVKDIAIAACAHAISPHVLRALISQEFMRLDLIPYLKIVCAAYHRNSESVSAVEAEKATAFMVAHEKMKHNSGLYLQALVHILRAGIAPGSLIYSHIHTEAIVTIPEFAKRLQSLKLNNQWRRAYELAEWLPKVLETCRGLPSENLSPIELLDRNFRGWRTWTDWRPNLARITLWENFTTPQRESLRDLLALEGPDATHSGMDTLCKRLQAQRFSPSQCTVRTGTFSFKLTGKVPNEAHILLGRLMKSIDAACAAGPKDTALLTYFCVNNTVTLEILELLDKVIAAADPSITALVSQVYAVPSDDKRTQLAAVIQLLPVLSHDRFQLLRKTIGSHLARLVTDEVEAMQSSLRGEWDAKISSIDTESKLQAFGEKLQSVSWLWPFFDQNLGELIKDWLKSEDLRNLQSIRTLAKTAEPKTSLSLLGKVDSYFKDCLVKRNTATEDTRSLMKALVYLWHQAPDELRVSVALSIAQGRGLSSKFQCRCLDQLPTLPDGFLSSLRAIIRNYDENSDISCVDLAQLLSSADKREVIPCWRPVLSRMIEQRGSTLIDYTLARMNAGEWVQWLGNLRFVYGDNHPGFPTITILEPGLLKWAERLKKYVPTLVRLEDKLGRGSTIGCLYLGGDGKCEDVLEQIIKLFSSNMEGHSMEAMIAVISLLKSTGSNASIILQTLHALFYATEECATSCLRLVEMHHNKSRDVAEILLASWLQNSILTIPDQQALKFTADALSIRAGGLGRISEDSLEAVADYFNDRYATLLAEAQRLESKRAVLKGIDYDGTRTLLESNGIEDPSAIEDAIRRLPIELLHIVEKVGDQEIEMLLPLSHLTQLQRAAMGVGKAQNLVARFLINEYGVPPKFCIHLDDEPKPDASGSAHAPWIVSGNTEDFRFCHGGVTTPGTYQLGRILSRHLSGGFKSLELIVSQLTEALKVMGNSCITCGSPHGTPLHRSTVCKAAKCNEIFLYTSLEIQLAVILQDPAAVDLLLTMVHSAIISGYHHLLPECPFDKEVVLKLLDNMPSMDSLQSANSFSIEIKGLGVRAVKLLTWVCNSYRGFLASATGPLRIPRYVFSEPIHLIQDIVCGGNTILLPKHDFVLPASSGFFPELVILTR